MLQQRNVFHALLLVLWSDGQGSSSKRFFCGCSHRRAGKCLPKFGYPVELLKVLAKIKIKMVLVKGYQTKNVQGYCNFSSTQNLRLEILTSTIIIKVVYHYYMVSPKIRTCRQGCSEDRIELVNYTINID